MAHTLPLDELTAAVAATAFRSGYSCDDCAVSDVFGHTKRRYLADNFDSNRWLFYFHNVIFIHLRRTKQVAGLLFVCYFILSPPLVLR